MSRITIVTTLDQPSVLSSATDRIKKLSSTQLRLRASTDRAKMAAEPNKKHTQLPRHTHDALRASNLCARFDQLGTTRDRQHDFRTLFPRYKTPARRSPRTAHAYTGKGQPHHPLHISYHQLHICYKNIYTSRGGRSGPAALPLSCAPRPPPPPHPILSGPQHFLLYDTTRHGRYGRTIYA